MAVGQATSQLEHTVGVEITSEEIRWRMEIVRDAVLRNGESFETVSKDFSKALAVLSQGTA